MKQVTAIKHKDIFGTGISMTLIHDPKYDPPLTFYKDKEDCEITKLKIEK